jgi:uncharacterized protein involved in outer membrane biogenesis
MTRPRRKTLVLLTVAAVLVATAAAWDWNWFRAPLERHLTERSGRDVHLGDLHVSFDGLDPTVRLRQVRIPNVAWARATAGLPFAEAGEVSFTFAWRSLIERRPVVSRLLLVDARVALERRADGLRNWRLRTPDDRGPGKFKFLRLEARNSTLRFAHEAVGLDVSTTATALPAEVPVEHGAPLTTRIDFDGTFRDATFKGTATTSRVLTFLETGEPFSLRGAATSAKTRFEADGQVTDLFKLSAVDALLHLSGPSLADVRGLLPHAWPDTAKYDARARLAKADDQWSFTEVKAEVGRSDFTGEARYNANGDRPYLEATLSSRSTHVMDVWPKPAAAGPARPEPAAKSELDLRPFDGDVTLDVRSLHVPGLPPLSQFRVKAHLDDGLLDITPVQWQLAGGSVQGLLSVDGRKQPPTARAELAWRNLRLEQLLPALPDKGEATGPVSGQAKLTSRGGTWQDLVANANGQGGAQLKGGRLSAGLDAKLGLNGGKLLRAKVADTPDVPILCARVDVVVRDGRGDVFPLLLDTAQTRVDGRGQVDLRDQRFELVLTPSPKQAALLSLHQSIQVKGTFDDAHIALVKADPIETKEGCDTTPAVKASR